MRSLILSSPPGKQTPSDFSPFPFTLPARHPPPPPPPPPRPSWTPPPPARRPEKLVIRHGLIEKVFHQTKIAIFTKKRLSAAAPASCFFKSNNKRISVILIWEMHMSAPSPGSLPLPWALPPAPPWSSPRGAGTPRGGGKRRDWNRKKIPNHCRKKKQYSNWMHFLWSCNALS